MTAKSDTIVAIMELNPTANPAFLAEFSNDELWEYLYRLAERTEFQPPPGSTPNAAAGPGASGALDLDYVQK